MLYLFKVHTFTIPGALCLPLRSWQCALKTQFISKLGTPQWHFCRIIFPSITAFHFLLILYRTFKAIIKSNIEITIKATILSWSSEILRLSRTSMTSSVAQLEQPPPEQLPIGQPRGRWNR